MRISVPILFSIIQIGFSSNAMAGVRETNICIRNTTSHSHLIQIADIDNYDWEGNNRPDHNFNNLNILAGEIICRREDTNNNSSPPNFTFVIDGNPTRMTLQSTYRFWRAGKGYDYSDYRWGAYTNTSNPTTLHGEKTIYWQDSDWWVGYKCDAEACTIFELR